MERKFKDVGGVPSDYTGKATFENNTVIFFKEGKIHRVDGPAIIFPDGSESYVQNGKEHRIDGPAIVTTGLKIWYLNGKKVTAGVVFNEMTEQQKEKAVWDLDEWK